MTGGGVGAAGPFPFGNLPAGLQDAILARLTPMEHAMAALAMSDRDGVARAQARFQKPERVRLDVVYDFATAERTGRSPIIVIRDPSPETVRHWMMTETDYLSMTLTVENDWMTMEMTNDPTTISSMKNRITTRFRVNDVSYVYEVYYDRTFLAETQAPVLVATGTMFVYRNPRRDGCQMGLRRLYMALPWVERVAGMPLVVPEGVPKGGGIAAGIGGVGGVGLKAALRGAGAAALWRGASTYDAAVKDAYERMSDPFPRAKTVPVLYAPKARKRFFVDWSRVDTKVAKIAH